jgi:hypothetical protein
MTKYHAIQNKQTGALFVGRRGTSVFNTKWNRETNVKLNVNPFWESIVVKLVVVEETL